MSAIRLSVGIILAGWLLSTGEVQAQMFGSRSGSGSSILSQNRLGTENSGTSLGGVGTLNFNERFVRGNRQAGDFVGKDSRNQRGFIGAQAVNTGRARAAVSGRIHSAPDANRSAPAPGAHGSAYEPRLSVAFDVTAPTGMQTAESLARHFLPSPGFQPTSQIDLN